MDNIGYALAVDLDNAFPEVVEEMGTRLYWGLRRMSADHQEAEDLTQETFIRAYNALSGYDRQRIRDMKLESWLWTIALNLGRNHVRDRSRRPTWVELKDLGSTEDPEIADGQAWDRRLGCLNRHQRTAVVLRHVIGMGIPDITEATGRPAGTVKADIHRGLAKLKEVMEDET
jgi:RNA polymerase sigma-70 factor (ECF subfamily)